MKWEGKKDNKVGLGQDSFEWYRQANFVLKDAIFFDTFRGGTVKPDCRITTPKSRTT